MARLHRARFDEVLRLAANLHVEARDARTGRLVCERHVHNHVTQTFTKLLAQVLAGTVAPSTLWTISRLGIGAGLILNNFASWTNGGMTSLTSTTATLNGNGTPSGTQTASSPTLTVVPGMTYTLSAVIAAAQVTAGAPLIGVYDPSGATTYATAPQVAGTTGNVTATWTCPGGVTSVKLMVSSANATIALGQTLTWTTPQLTPVEASTVDTLQNEVFRDIPTLTQIDANGMGVTTKYYLPTSGLNGYTLSEAALLADNATPNAIAKAGFVPIAKTALQTVTFQWDVTLTPSGVT